MNRRQQIILSSMLIVLAVRQVTRVENE